MRRTQHRGNNKGGGPADDFYTFRFINHHTSHTTDPNNIYRTLHIAGVCAFAVPLSRLVDAYLKLAIRGIPWGRQWQFDAVGRFGPCQNGSFNMTWRLVGSD